MGHKKEYDNAIKDYTEAIRLDPQDGDAYNGRAWLRATCPDEKYRDGKLAVVDATRACELNPKSPYHLGTLSAAYAEEGDFDAAIQAQIKAIELGDSEYDKKAAEERLALYRDKQPYREPPAAPQ